MNARRPGAGSFTAGQLKNLSNLPARAGKKFEVLYWHLTLVQNWATRYRNSESFVIYLQEYSIIKPYQRDLNNQNSWLNKLEHFWGYFQPERSYSRKLPPFWKWVTRGHHYKRLLRKSSSSPRKSNSCLPCSLQPSMLIVLKCFKSCKYQGYFIFGKSKRIYFRFDKIQTTHFNTTVTIIHLPALW